MLKDPPARGPILGGLGKHFQFAALVQPGVETPETPWVIPGLSRPCGAESAAR